MNVLIITRERTADYVVQGGKIGSLQKEMERLTQELVRHKAVCRQ